MNIYYIYTDSGSRETKARSLRAALDEFGAPTWVRTKKSFERWLTGCGGYGAIQKNGVEIVRVGR